jgi:uncharacterized protein YgiM (DUF1202 family)
MSPKHFAARPSPLALTGLWALTLFLGLIWSCAQFPVQPPEVTYFVTPQVTYLLEKPVYGSNILGPLYKGDKVERVGGEQDWWQVTLARSGQTGWIRQELLSPHPVPNIFYYIRTDSQPLLECPQTDCLPIQMLFRGDEVQKIAAGKDGWWRVLVIKSRSLGWLPADTLTERIEAARQHEAEKSYYYVAVRKLGLRAIPSERSAAFRTLKFNDQVAKIAEAKGWFKVREPSSGAVGWVRSNALSSLPSIYPLGSRPAPKKVRPFKPREEPEVEPEFM